MTKQILFEQTIPVTSGLILEQVREQPEQWRGKIVEIWLYEGVQARRRLANQLSEFGISAKVRSAYKPLLQWFLFEQIEEGLATDLQRVDIRYPVDLRTDSRRFVCEAYPLDMLLPGVEIVWSSQLPSQTHTYEIKLIYKDNTVVCHQVFAPNIATVDHSDKQILRPTGCIRVNDESTGKELSTRFIKTEIELGYDNLMHAIKTVDWGLKEPYFGRLHIQIDLPGAEIRSADGLLLASTYEALHEEIYFSALEFFQQYSKRPVGDRGLQPGQIVPDVRAAYGKNLDRLKIQIICYESGVRADPLIEKPIESNELLQLSQLAGASTMLSQQAVANCLEQITGASFDCRSFQDRPIFGKHRSGNLPAIVVTGGQHANESTGVVGALRAGHWLETQPDAHFAVVPLENPDGYQLFSEYCAIHPEHMHHAARYTALGDDLEYREKAPWFERAARLQALAVTGAQLHLSLHGYPAHEWTRPFTGYLPRGFELWSIPKGFFLIVRYRDGWEDKAKQLLQELTARLGQIPELAIYNQVQLKRFETYAGRLTFDVQHGIATMFSRNDRQVPGIVIVTEIPDETIYGQAFSFAHQIQLETVKIASAIWWRLMAADES